MVINVTKNVTTIINKMEIALYLNSSTEINNYDLNKYQRIIFGNEFCENLIPDILEIKFIINYITNHNIKLTFLTPLSTNKGIKKLINIFKILPLDTEVVFNDWGVFELLKNYNLKKVLGKLLIKTKKDPRICDLNPIIINKINRTILTKSFQNFLIENKIFRVELDNINYKYNLNNLNSNIKITLYYPLVYVSSTRKCTINNYFSQNKKIELNNNCEFNCIKNMFQFKFYNHNMIIKGNSIFYINKKKTNFNLKNLDRIVVVTNLFLNQNFSKEWNEYYFLNKKNADWGYLEADKHVIEFINYFKIKNKINVLDIGCGHGKNSEYLLKKGFTTYGIDISKKAIYYSKKRNKKGIFKQMNAIQTDFKDSFFDVIIDAGCLHVNNKKYWEIIINEYYRILKKDGVFFIRLFKLNNHNNDDEIIFKINDKLDVFGIKKDEIEKYFKNFKIEKLIYDPHYKPKPIYYIYFRKL